MYVLNFIRGFCMALADSVPGVSGGTVAFLLGFYDKFIGSLDDIITGSIPRKKAALLFLIKIGIGWVVGFLLAVSILASIFDSHIYQISSLFIGFILFAIPIIIIEEKDSIKGRYGNLLFAAIGIIVVFAISYFNPVSGQGIQIDIGSLTLKLVLYVFISAMLAISAMVLPGISGSTLLLIFGLYVPIISAIKSVMSFQFGYIPILLVFSLGMLAGIATIVKLIKYALEHYRSQMIYLIIGLMIGSFYAIIMGPTTLETPKPPMTPADFSILYFLIGGLVILSLQKLKTIMEGQS